MVLECFVCKKASGEGVTISKCSRCKSRYYCGRECQTADWASHKSNCGRKWYDKHRKCQDGNLHEGDLEIITYSGTFEGEELGWGACLVEEAEDLRQKFLTEYGGDEQKFFEYWPQGYRWTCCGTPGDVSYGCDHHGTGSMPCTCDFCRMGKPLPDRIYNKSSVSRYGLNLARGPDPRSYNSTMAATAEKARAFLSLDSQ